MVCDYGLCVCVAMACVSCLAERISCGDGLCVCVATRMACVYVCVCVCVAMACVCVVIVCVCAWCWRVRVVGGCVRGDSACVCVRSFTCVLPRFADQLWRRRSLPQFVGGTACVRA